MEIEFDKIGIIPKEQEDKLSPDFVKPMGLYIDKDLVLKLYEMRSEQKLVDFDFLERASSLKKFITEKRGKSEIQSRSGLGFVIDTKNIININIWGGTTLLQTLYSVEDKRKLSVEDYGSFDVWELEIVHFETRAWEHYLHSLRTTEDKRRYVDNAIHCKLG